MELNKFRLFLVGLALLAGCQYIEAAGKLVPKNPNDALLANYKSYDIEHFLAGSPKYYTDNEIDTLFATLAAKYPTLAKVHSLGISAKGRVLIAIQITNNVHEDRELLKPMFKYVANMHGNEAVGRELLVYFAQFLLDNYGTNAEVTELVNTVDIFLVPSMNPDGFNGEHRLNTHNVDLNRDFMDRINPSDPTYFQTRYYAEPETGAMMEFIFAHPFVLSANMHGGKIVACYPFDHSNGQENNSTTPDEELFIELAMVYSRNHLKMKTGKNCYAEFTDGIVKGADWYELTGSMQDFNYIYTNAFEITLELSCVKFPHPRELSDEWALNKKSMVEYLKMVHVGIKGIVSDSNGNPVKNAKIIVAGLEGKPIKSTARGEYWRLLLPGDHLVKVVADGYQSTAFEPVTVHPGKSTILNFTITSA